MTLSLLRFSISTLLVCVTSLQVVTAQAILNRTISLTVDNQDIKTVLKSIEKAADVSFSYRSSLLPKGQKVSFIAQNERLKTVLDNLFKPLFIQYEVVKEQIILTQIESVSKTDPSVFPQKKEDTESEKELFTVSGLVTNSENEPLVGASIQMDRSSKGTITDQNGRFSLKLTGDESESIVICRFIGYETKEIPLSKQPILTIILQSRLQQLNEVMVVAYGTQKRTIYTGAAVNVDMETLENAPRASFQESLQGNVAGLLSTNGSGQPGSVPSVRIRGIGSINASSAPLYVVDGIPVVSGDITGYNTNTLSAINPNDIASLVVLKDASATALYGSRGANGVILITTKKGQVGKAKIQLNVQKGANYNPISDKNKTLNTQEAIQYLREAWINAGLNPDLFNQELKNRAIDTTINTDWFNAVLQNGNFLNADLAISGGTERNTFFLSSSYNKSESVQQGIGYQRGTMRLNIKNNTTQRLTINGGIGLSYQQSSNSLGGSSFANPMRSMYRLQPWLPVKNNDGNYNLSYNNGYNPVALIENNTRKGDTYNLNSSIGAVYQLTPFLSLENREAIDFNHGVAQSYSDPRFGNLNVSVGGVVENYVQDIVNWNITNIIRFKKEWQKQALEIFGGYEASKRTDKDQSDTFNQLVPNLKTGTSVASTATETSNSLLSSFFNAQYAFRSRYYASASFRRDGSSRFGSDNRFGKFWSVGGGWNLHKEPFLTTKYFSEGRIRVSYGATGNQTNIDNFGSRGLYFIGNDYNSVPGYVFSQFENTTLTWEKNYPFNLGCDFSFFKNRLSLTADYYFRTTKSLLLEVLVPATNGISSYLDNYGSLTNEGFELSLSSINFQPAKQNGFKWTTNIVFSTNKNTITNINAPIRSDFLNRDIGTDVYQWFLIGYAGTDPATGKALWYKDGAKQVTVTSFGAANRFNQGSALPAFYGSVSNSLQYKSLSFKCQLYVYWGNKVRDIHGVFTSADASAGFSATGNILRYNFENRWQKVGDITDVPKPIYLGQQTGLSNMMSTRFLYDGSYIRLRDIEFAYRLPDIFIKRMKMSHSKVYFRSNNLWTWVKDKRLNFDPEVPIGGTLDQRPPNFKTLLVGLDMGF
ncbi:MAG: SusC/RagA family TonB-linked outer membrane protein [Saprospiraceae bacterium]|nr:SusC/RagA family TonB-linked outer membrane protein [Saprospiraceae bacterium]